MGLVKCPDCGKEFSDRINACPNCFCPIEEAKKENSLSAKEVKHDSKSSKDILSKKGFKDIYGIIDLFLLSYLLIIAGEQRNGNINLTTLSSGLIDASIYSVVFCIVPIVLYLINENVFQKDYKFKLIINSWVGWIIITIINAVIGNIDTVSQIFEFIGETFYIPIIYYFINKNIYCGERHYRRNPISIIFLIILSLSLLLTVFSSFKNG